MENYHAEVAVLLKDTVNDPQGVTAANSLKSIGFEGIQSIRIGKIIEVDLVAENQDAAYRMVADMCELVRRSLDRRKAIGIGAGVR